MDDTEYDWNDDEHHADIEKVAKMVDALGLHVTEENEGSLRRIAEMSANDVLTIMQLPDEEKVRVSVTNSEQQLVADEEMRTGECEVEDMPQDSSVTIQVGTLKTSLREAVEQISQGTLQNNMIKIGEGVILYVDEPDGWVLHANSLQA